MHTHRKACVLVRQEQIYFLSDLITANCSAETVKAGLVTLKTCYPPPHQVNMKINLIQFIFFSKSRAVIKCYVPTDITSYFFFNALICFFNTFMHATEAL